MYIFERFSVLNYTAPDILVQENVLRLLLIFLYHPWLNIFMNVTVKVNKFTVWAVETEQCICVNVCIMYYIEANNEKLFRVTVNFNPIFLTTLMLLRQTKIAHIPCGWMPKLMHFGAE